MCVGWVRANPIEPFNLYWRNSRFSIGEVNAYTKDQKFNHFINSGTITKKVAIVPIFMLHVSYKFH